MRSIIPIIPLRPAPSPELYSSVRGILVSNGTNLNQWCKSKGLRRQSIEKVLKGEWKGHKADKTLELFLTEIMPPAKAA